MDRRSSGARRWLLLGAAAACLGYLAVELLQLDGGLGWPLDDSWIHLQFARNLAAGRGLSYNPGELVTGSTAPLWTALLALLAYLPGSPLAWAQLAGALLYLAGVDAAWRLARELGLPPGLAALAGGLTLGTGWLVWSALSGMEIPLFVLLSTWGMVRHLQERRAADALPLAPAVLALAALARPEGLLLLALAFVDGCLRFDRSSGAASQGDPAPGEVSAAPADGEAAPGMVSAVAPLRWRRPPFARLARGGLLAACVLAGPLLFYRIAGGTFLPTTFAAKGGEMRHWLPDLQYVYGVMGILLRPQPVMTLLCCGGAAALVARLGSRRDRGLLPALWLVALPLVYSTLSPPGKILAGNFGRYFFPLFPVVVVLGAVALEGAAGVLRPGVMAGKVRLPAGLVLAALLLWPTASSFLQCAGLYARNLADVESSDVRAARWLAARLPAGAVLAVNDIGAFKYLLPNRIVDLAGIANPELRLEVQRQVARGVPWERAMAAAVVGRRPDYVAIFPAWLPHLASELGLQPLLRLRLQGNKTMGSDELVVYSTPWTRYALRRLPGDPE
ncbi:MAG TPA: hypothetical protein VE075_02495 [Thermoanaerobaculia bacterium]|nr:hypothetical protein [Thermoanaerobaculia bacterium]